MKEIGGYIEIEHYHGREFHDGIALNSGRNCLRYLIKARKINKIAIPDWCCSTIEKVCKEEKVYISKYHVESLTQPYRKKMPPDDVYIYIINYYGQIDISYISHIRRLHKNIIIDNAQAFFQKPIDGIDTIYTCRKYFGVPDGAYLYTDCMLKERLKRDFSYNRMKHLLGRYECGANKYFGLYQECEEQLEGHALMKMSELTQNILKSIDYKYVEEKRTNNFKVLHNRLKAKNEIEIKVAEGAYMYPYQVCYAKGLREKLIQKKIYIPMLWSGTENIYGERIIPLPCDQRYNKEDMEYVINTINKIEELLS